MVVQLSDTNVDKEYRDTMQELMIELKLSTHKFIKKFAEETKKSKLLELVIPITISLRGNYADLEKDLFGISKKTSNPRNLDIPDLKNIRLLNTDTTIMDGVTLTHGKNTFYREDTSKKPEFNDYHYFLLISKNVLDIVVNVTVIADSLLDKIKNHDCRLIIEGKEISNKDELQTILNVIIHKSNS